jgi:hypothetical protein
MDAAGSSEAFKSDYYCSFPDDFALNIHRRENQIAQCLTRKNSLDMYVKFQCKGTAVNIIILRENSLTVLVVAP